jgi:hypothetical protein
MLFLCSILIKIEQGILEKVINNNISILKFYQSAVLSDRWSEHVWHGFHVVPNTKHTQG